MFLIKESHFQVSKKRTKEQVLRKTNEVTGDWWNVKKRNGNREER